MARAQPIVPRLMAGRIIKNGCWIWTKSLDRDGYGQVSYHGRNRKLHRVAYMVFIGDIPGRMCVLHKCDNRACFNPKHLFLGTPADNIADMMNKNRNRQPQGATHPHAKLDDTAVMDIRTSGEALRVLSQRYGVSETTIWLARTGRKWRHVPMPTEMSI